MSSIRLISLILLFVPSLGAQGRDYRFDGSMSEEVLRSYLSRAMTTMYLLTGQGDFEDNIRMLRGQVSSLSEVALEIEEQILPAVDEKFPSAGPNRFLQTIRTYNPPK